MVEDSTYINEPFENSYQGIVNNSESRKNNQRTKNHIQKRDVENLNNIETRLLNLGLL